MHKPAYFERGADCSHRSQARLSGAAYSFNCLLIIRIRLRLLTFPGYGHPSLRILLQLPLPEALQQHSNDLINKIDPNKDIDGLTIVNMGKLVAGMKGIVPCTPASALELIHSVKADLKGLHAVVISHSLLFGKPMAQLLLAEDVTVTTAHHFL